MRSRGYVFTLNNYTEQEVDDLRHCGSKYLIFGKEIGENGTPHLQGYMWFATLKSLKQMKKISPRAHFEAQRGSFEQAIDYCKKDGSFEERGTAPMSRKEKGDTGAKRRREKNLSCIEKDLSQLVEDGTISINEVAVIKRAKHLLLNDGEPYSAEDVRGEWFYGPPGTGKSHKARQDNPGAYIKQQDAYWDDYEGEEVVILDDFDFSGLGHYLKIWADKYPCKGKVKHMPSIPLKHKKLIITSNYLPEELWPDNEAMTKAVRRRFKITHFNKLH